MSARNEMAQLTWVEIGEWARRDPVVLVPIGAMECEGPQLPVGMDYLVANRVASRVARETGSLVGPGVPYGMSAGFTGFPGTVALKAETMAAFLRGIMLALVSHGFRRFLFVSNHGPNGPVVEGVAREIMEAHKGVIIALVWPAELAQKAAAEIGVPAAELGHGADPSTSIMLAIDPENVRMDLAAADRLPTLGDLKLKSSFHAELKGIPLGWYIQVSDWSKTGVTGSPFGASAERGQKIFDRICAMVKEVVSFLASKELDG
jgi:creatinine amidohydrolase